MVIKNILICTSGVIFILLVIIGSVGTYNLCNSNGQCINVLHNFFLHFLPFSVLFIFALITYWMREEIYRAWFKFARWWIPLSMILILISPEYSHDWMYRIEKGTVAFATSLLFVIVSLIIIITKLASSRRTIQR